MESTALVISVVTICFNCKDEIRKTVESVLAQDYPFIDYVVIDGGSKDGTADIVREYGTRISTFVSEPDKGIYNAMNKGLLQCKGDYVVFVNAGDGFASPDVLSDVAKHIFSSGSFPDLVYGTYREEGSETVIPNYSHTKCWYGMFASHQAMFYNLAFLRKHGITYDESYRIAADYKLTLQTVREGSRFLRIPTCISQFDTNGVSCNNPRLGMDEACRARAEVLGFGRVRNSFVLLLAKSAHAMRRNFAPLYKKLRYK